MTSDNRFRALLNATPAQLSAIDKVLNGTAKQEENIDRIIRRAEAAKLLGRSLRAIDLLREQKILTPVTLPGRERGAGFKLSSIMALIGGRA